MKYDVKFCECGRVHFIDEEKINKAIENNKQIIVVCNHCGDSFVIGADKQIDEDGKIIYMMYSFDKQNTEINDMSNIDSIIFTAGEQIRMVTGGEATYYGDGTFIDWETKKPDNVTSKEWEQMQRTVNTQHTINWIRDDNKLEHLSHYYSTIDWKGTKYEKSWHK